MCMDEFNQINNMHLENRNEWIFISFNLKLCNLTDFQQQTIFFLPQSQPIRCLTNRYVGFGLVIDFL